MHSEREGMTKMSDEISKIISFMISMSNKDSPIAANQLSEIINASIMS